MSQFSLRGLLRSLVEPVMDRLPSADDVTTGVEGAKAVFELAQVLDEGKFEDNRIAELACRIPTLLEVLNSPLAEVVSSALPFAPVATGLLKYFYEKTRKEPTLGQCAALVVQAAYLKSFQEMSKSGSFKFEQDKAVSERLQRQIAKLGDLEIDDKQARLSLVYFHESKIAEGFNRVLIERLEEAGVKSNEAERFVERVARNADQYVVESLASVADKATELVEWYRLGGKEEFEKYWSIDQYLSGTIQKLPEEKVFCEDFTFQQIYTPLEAVNLDENGDRKDNSSAFVLEEEVKKLIQDQSKQDKVIFIEAGPGRGKSVFCRMFADWARENLHPQLTPILICLRDIESFQQSFEKTLTDALLHVDFVSSDAGWLTDKKTQFLFLLDAFDELRLEGRESGGVDRFIKQVCHFQERFTSSEKRHRTILTGRPLALQGISYLPDNLHRIEIEPMDEALQKIWLGKWQDIIKSTNEVEAFQQFLQAENCPDSVKELAREPLLLYLLAAMHRDKEINLDDFQNTDALDSKITIYEKSLDWVITQQRKKELQYNITGLKKESLLRILEEAGCCVVQSGGEYAQLAMIETRLEKKDADKVRELKQQKGGEKTLSTALGAFYLREAQQGGCVEFYHKSFSEFLCAKRMLSRFEEWVEEHRRRDFDIEDEILAKQIYDLLGYGFLTQEITEYLRGLLKKQWEKEVNENEDIDNPKLIILFSRLNGFYQQWCSGDFIDADGETHPQRKMRDLGKYLTEGLAKPGQRQVDVFTGLNIMILLLEFHRYGLGKTELAEKLNFSLCGERDKEGKLIDDTLFYRLIGYSQCLGVNAFSQSVGRFLEQANLSGAYLDGTMLSHAILSGAILSGAILSGAILSRAHLDGAILSRANLSSAYLHGAILFSAHLDGANLSGANLSGAILSGANLSGANLDGANLNNISWNEHTVWENIRGFEKAINAPKELRL